MPFPKFTKRTVVNNEFEAISTDLIGIVFLLILEIIVILFTWYVASEVSGHPFFDHTETVYIIIAATCVTTIGISSIYLFQHLARLKKLHNENIRVNSMLELDIKKRIEVESALILSLTHDELTHLGNRNLLKDQLHYFISQIKSNAIKDFGFILININRFKSINDSLGIQIGDELLKMVGSRILHSFPQNDTVFRLGSDEFGIIVHDITSNEESVTVQIESILSMFSYPFEIGKRKIYITVSMGVNIVDSTELLPETIIKGTDIALHEARNKGKNTYSFFDNDQYNRVLEILTMEQNLRSAINNQEFHLYYQPIINLSNYSLSGFETLIRWPGENHTIVQPDKFIPLAEDTDLVIPLTWWILEEACKTLKDFQEHFQNHNLTVSVNFSIKQFYELDIVERILTILEQSSLPVHCLKIEVTESIIQDSDEIIKVMKDISSSGIQIYLDDFGTGFSSLGSLNILPIKAVKIDKSFIRDLDDFKSQEITRAMVSLAHSIGLKTIVEGIETLDQLIFIKHIGAQFGQGFYFSKPLDADSIKKLTFPITPLS
jgi:diguanylate cyclase (GGDEF)-like protein